MKTLHLISAVCACLLSISASCDVVDYADIDGLRTFQDTNTNRVRLDMDNFFNKSTREMLAIANSAGFTFATAADVHELLDTLPTTSDLYINVYLQIMGGHHLKRDIIWGTYDVGLETLGVASNYITYWYFEDGTGETLDSIPNSDLVGEYSGYTDMNVWAYMDTAAVSINNPQGEMQECNDTEGTVVSMSANVSILDTDAINSIIWALDDVPVANGVYAELFIPLGTHKVEVTLSTVGGFNASDTETVIIKDTIPPNIIAIFIDPKNSIEISEITSNEKAEISVNVNDKCDPSPLISSTAGIPAENGDIVSAKTSKKDSNLSVSVKGKADYVELAVTAEDSSGNMSSNKAVLTIIP